MKLFIATFFCMLLWLSGGYAQVAVIANESVPVDKISKEELLDFYTGDIREWSDKTSVIVLDLKPKGDTKNAFYDFLGKSTSRMKSIWMKNMLSGEGDPPEALNTETELLAKVSDTPGAIGFCNQEIITEGMAIKILAVIPDEN